MENFLAHAKCWQFDEKRTWHERKDLNARLDEKPLQSFRNYCCFYFLVWHVSGYRNWNFYIAERNNCKVFGLFPIAPCSVPFLRFPTKYPWNKPAPSHIENELSRMEFMLLSCRRRGKKREIFTRIAACNDDRLFTKGIMAKGGEIKLSINCIGCSQGEFTRL